MENTIVQYGLCIAILVVLAVPLGGYIGKVMNGEKVFLTGLLSPVERLIYRTLKINKEEQMGWKKYAVSIGAFSLFSFVFLFLILLLQGVLPLNPQGVKGMSPDLAFNTAVSYVTRRGFYVLFFTDGRIDRAEFCIGGSWNFCPICTDTGICKGEIRGAWKFLGRFDKNSSLYTDSTFYPCVCPPGIAGSCAKLKQK